MDPLIEKSTKVASFDHTLTTRPRTSEQTLSYATPQCVGILLTFFINQVT